MWNYLRAWWINMWFLPRILFRHLFLLFHFIVGSLTADKKKKVPQFFFSQYNKGIGRTVRHDKMSPGLIIWDFTCRLITPRRGGTGFPPNSLGSANPKLHSYGFKRGPLCSQWGYGNRWATCTICCMDPCCEDKALTDSPRPLPLLKSQI